MKLKRKKRRIKILEEPSIYEKPNKKMSLGPQQKDTTMTKIFVGGLPYHTTDDSLRQFFDVFGDIEEAVVITDRQTGKSRGYGFVTMAKKEDAQKAIQEPNPIIDGRKANVNLAYIGAKPRLMQIPLGGLGGLYQNAALNPQSQMITQRGMYSTMQQQQAALLQNAGFQMAYGYQPMMNQATLLQLQQQQELLAAQLAMDPSGLMGYMDPTQAYQQAALLQQAQFAGGSHLSGNHGIAGLAGLQHQSQQHAAAQAGSQPSSASDQSNVLNRGGSF